MYAQNMLQSRFNRCNTVLYRKKLIPSDQHADVDMRSVKTEKSNICEVVSLNEAAGNCIPEQTSASQFEPLAEGDQQTTQISVVVGWN